MAATSRWRGFSLRCGLVVFSTLLALGIGEIAMRLLGVSYPVPYVPDPQTGSRFRPSWSGWFNKEGRSFVTINSAGFRDREHTSARPANAFRILVLGDSYVEAVQLPQQETFWSILEQQLQPAFDPLGKRVEVIAMGISGWGTAQQLQALENYGLSYQPDVVVLAFLAANDLRNNSRQLEGDNGRPYFVLKDGNLRLDDSFRSDPQFLKANSRSTAFKVAWINQSRLLQWVQEFRERWKYHGQIQESGARAGLDDACFLEPASAEWQDAWTVTERIIQRMHEVSQQHGARFLVATIASGIQVHPDAAVREANQHRLGVKNLDYADDRIRQLGERFGFPVLVLSGPMREYAEQQRTYLHGFANTQLGEGHWNAAGHRLAGEILASRLREEPFLENERTLD